MVFDCANPPAGGIVCVRVVGQDAVPVAVLDAQRQTAAIIAIQALNATRQRGCDQPPVRIIGKGGGAGAPIRNAGQLVRRIIGVGRTAPIGVGKPRPVADRIVAILPPSDKVTVTGRLAAS